MENVPMRRPVADVSRFRLKLLGTAVLMALVAGCGDGIPKDRDDEDDDTPPPAQTAALSVFAGDATVDGTMDGAGTAARFNNPHGLAIDSSGNLYVADRGNYVIRKITPEGVVTTLAGGAGQSRLTNGTAANARFVNPVALTVGSGGTIYVADELNIRSITSAGLVATVTTIPIANNVATASRPDVTPGAIAVDVNNNLYVTNNYGTRRFVIGAATTAILEGQNTVNDLFGTRTLAPRGVAVDSSNVVYLFDLEREISRWNPTANFGSDNLFTMAGAQNARGAVNGTGNAARFEQVVALTIDPQGNVYAADAVNNLVRKITPAGVVTTVAGTARATALRIGDLPGSLGDIRGIVTDGKGLLYVTSGNAVVKIQLP
jgi:secreted PhoX family phosphatase